MNNLTCWFCNQPLSSSHCNSKSCRQKNVTFIRVGETLLKVQLKTSIYSNNKCRDYFVNYHPPKRTMEVIEQIRFPVDNNAECPWENFEFKDVLSIPYDHLIITPTNIDTKLITLLTFS